MTILLYQTFVKITSIVLIALIFTNLKERFPFLLMIKYPFNVTLQPYLILTRVTWRK